jgi:4-amino-4-deoxy-L-arabinose transferase-like glycosyltransferase
MVLAGSLFRWWTAGRSSGIWTDEAEFLFIATSGSVGEVLNFLRSHESHPPLFYLLERLWLSCFGTSTEVAVVLSVLLGVLLIPAVYAAGRRMFSGWVGGAAAILTAANPFLSHYSGYARPYSLLPLLALLSCWCVWEALGNNAPRRWAVYVLVTTTMLLTHNWAWLIFASQVIVATVWLGYSGRPTPGFHVKGMLGAIAAVVLAYGWWVPSLAWQIQHAGHAARKEWTAAAPMFPFTEFARVAIGYPAGVALLLLTALMATALTTGRREPPDLRPGRPLALALCIGVPALAIVAAAALSAKTWLTQEYCLLIPVPLALLAASRGLEVLAERRAAVPLLLGSIALASLYLFTWSALADLRKSNAREFALRLAREAHSSDVLLVTPAFLAPSFNYYFRGDQRQINFPFLERQTAIPYDRMQQRVADTAALRSVSEALDSVRLNGRRVWFVSRCDWFTYPREIPQTWIQRGWMTSDTPLLVSRWHDLRDRVQLLYGPSIPHGVEVQRASTREAFCAELYAGRP